MQPETIKRKLAKPPGACVNAWCRRPPEPGGKQCKQCRLYHRKWYWAKGRDKANARKRAKRAAARAAKGAA